MEGIPAYLRYRVINRVTGAVLTEDLPHLHQSTWTITGMQPGNPGAAAIGSFSIPLFPPGSDKFRLYKSIFDQMDYFLRVEGYLSHYGTVMGGAPAFAGIIRGIQRSYGEGATFELQGVTDIGFAHYSKPFFGEYLYLAYGSGLSTASSVRQAEHYFGANEVGWSDSFNPYTSGNYLSTNEPGLTASTWTGTTDDGLNVVTATAGTGGVLLALSGAASGDAAHRQFVEIHGRMLPSSDTANSGSCGVGLSKANTDINNSLMALVITKKNAGTGKWDIDVKLRKVVAGVVSDVTTISNALVGVSDPEGYIPLSIALSWAGGDQLTGQITVNGKPILTIPGSATALDPGTGTVYPFLRFGTPTTGTAIVYWSQLVQQIRYSHDGHANIAMFKPGTIDTPVHSLPLNAEPGPSFLEVWTRAATREGWYWRYTPQAYSTGTRTLGTVDMGAAPGTDLSNAVFFDRGRGNLILLEFNGNADQFVSGTTVSGPSSADGGGIAVWRDISSLTKYGVLDDDSLAIAASTWVELRHHARGILANKVALGMTVAKRAVVLRDPSTAGKWREQDFVSLNDPVLNINMLKARVLGYTFTEGDPRQTIWLDQFSADDPTLLLNRFKVAMFGVARRFTNR